MMAIGIRRLCALLCAALSLLVLQLTSYGIFDTLLVSAITVGIGFLVCLLIPLEDRTRPSWFHLLALVIGGLFLVCLWYWTTLMKEQESFFITFDPLDYWIAWAGIFLIGLMTWKHFGTPIASVYGLSIVYILLPSQFGGAGEDWTRVAENLWYSTDGVFGRPVEVVSRTVLIFIVFGGVLQSSGAGNILLKVAFAVTGRLPGGPAHAAIVGSSLFGSLSGAAVANVVSTGVVTIPIIKKIGFKPKFAGAVEAAASTGGQIMPPVMGVVAFLMSDMTGIPYLHIVLAAIIPAAMYYGSLFVMVTLEARKEGIRATPKSQREVLTRKDWLQSMSFWLPLLALILMMANGRSPQNAGFAATVVAFILCVALFPEFRHPRKWLEALVTAGRTSAVLMVVVAAVGFVIGVVNMTGVGLKFAEAILNTSGDSLIVSLVLVMLGCLVLGMGVPTGAAYLIIAVVLGPALQKLGLPTVAAHLFVVYFAVLSVVTPPVALAAFAAAAIAQTKPMATAFEAVRLSIAGFIIPFVFVFHTDVLLILDDFSSVGLVWALILFAAATWSVATALAGMDIAGLGLPERVLRGGLGLIVLSPQPYMAAPAVVGIGVVCVIHRLRHRRTSALSEETGPALD